LIISFEKILESNIYLKNERILFSFRSVSFLHLEPDSLLIFFLTIREELNRAINKLRKQD